MSWRDRDYSSRLGFDGGRFSDNPLTWAPTIGYVSGIRIRIHILFILFIAFQLLSDALDAEKSVATSAHWLLILFGSVFLHELGHCFAARHMRGEARQVLMWPLGGLAFVQVPRLPWPEFVTVIWGPLVNVILFAISGALLATGVAGHITLPLNPFGLYVMRDSWTSLQCWLLFIYEVNYLLFLFNMWPMFPMDAGRMLQCAVWWRLDLQRAVAITTTVGMVAAIVLGLCGLIQQEYLLIAIAVMGYLVCYQERQALKAGAIHEDGFMGYDFSGGHSTLEPETRRREGAFSKWRRNRAETRRREAEATLVRQQVEVDRILEKVSREGIQSLTRAEKRTLEAASKGPKDPQRNRV